MSTSPDRLRYKTWVTTPDGLRHYIGSYIGLDRLMRGIATSEAARQDGATIEIQVVET